MSIRHYELLGGEKHPEKQMIEDEVKGTLQIFPKISNKWEGKFDSIRKEQRSFHENS